jgi:hypothetical protein
VTIPRVHDLRVTFRGFVTLAIMAGFFWAYGENPSDPQMRNVLSNVFVAAVAYWLGSSHGAHENRDALNRLAEKAGGASDGL